MAEFEDKLSALLGNPEAMEKIAALASSMSGGSEKSAEPEQTSPPDDGTSPPDGSPPEEGGLEENPPAAGSEPQMDLSGILDLLGGLGGSGSPLSLLGDLDPSFLKKAMGLFSEYGTGDDRRVTLLSALRPFVKETRQAKVERAIQVAKLSRVIRIAFQFLKKEGEDEHV